MDMTRKELRKQYVEQQQKYVYYLLGITVTVIGFALHESKGVSIDIFQIPLAISLVSWLISLYCGLAFLKLVIGSLFQKERLLKIKEVKHEFRDDQLARLTDVEEERESHLVITSSRAERTGKLQYSLFFVGVISFVIWSVFNIINK